MRRNQPPPSQSRPAHDVKDRAGLTSIYNSKVVRAQRVERPLSGMNVKVGPFKHSGVVAETAGGSRWLVHKGKGEGYPVSGSKTVVTDARHMSGKWQVTRDQSVHGAAKVADYVKAGGPGYNAVLDNCHAGSERMIKIGQNKK